MSKYGNKFNNLTNTDHLRLFESSLEAEFNSLLDIRVFSKILIY